MTDDIRQKLACDTRCLTDCIGAILAGGRSRRMGGGRKALLSLVGKPLIRHVLDRLEPQVDTVVLSVDRASDALGRFGPKQVPDVSPGSNGPLGGLAAVLHHAQREGYRWLQLAPCDAPFIPMDLSLRLREHAQREGCDVVLVRQGGQLQPVFSIWHVSMRPALEDAVKVEGMGGFREFLGSRTHGVLDWPEADGNPFFNINDRRALREAERLAVGDSKETA
jgi:molybdopterin-guanine dinucleotide biosynthesis protein A